MQACFPTVVDRAKTPRQLDATAIPMICFYHAGGAVTTMRSFSKDLDEVTGDVAVNPVWVELPGGPQHFHVVLCACLRFVCCAGHGTRAKDALPNSVFDTSEAIAAAVAVGILKGDRSRPFFVFGHSCGTLHAYEVTRELEKLGFVPTALVVLSRQGTCWRAVCVIYAPV